MHNGPLISRDLAEALAESEAALEAYLRQFARLAGEQIDREFTDPNQFIEQRTGDETV
jgi:hypothetical protein